MVTPGSPGGLPAHLDDRARGSRGPVKVKEVGGALGLPVEVRGKLEPLRGKLTKLADRGWTGGRGRRDEPELGHGPMDAMDGLVEPLAQQQVAPYPMKQVVGKIGQERAAVDQQQRGQHADSRSTIVNPVVIGL